ncbi:MAG: TlpA family protein disulfide reductase [Planctomycetia bacterium]|nr:MAG: TlpA family protein disulfide reductase [Planctomycetia bacterium]
MSSIFAKAAVLTCLAAPAALAQSPAGVGMVAPGAPAALSADEQLWASIRAMESSDSPAGLSAPDRFAWHSERSRQVLARARAYQSLYPGGPRRDDAVELELAKLFELITGTGLPASELCARAERVAAGAPSRRALHEAEYWRMICDVERRRGAARAVAAPAAESAVGGGTTSPGGGVSGGPQVPSVAPRKAASVLDRDAELLGAYADYVRRFPDSRRTPRLAQVLFEDAAARSDLGDMRAMAVLLGPSDSLALRSAAATLRRFETIGRPLWVTFRDSASGDPIDTRKWVGSDVLVVVWAGFDAEARAAVATVEQARASDTGLRVVGVNLDAPACEGQRAARELGISWPQWNDGLGWAGAFSQEWGIREVPFILRLDAEGRLAGFYSGADAARRAVPPR